MKVMPSQNFEIYMCVYYLLIMPGIILIIFYLWGAIDRLMQKFKIKDNKANKTGEVL